MVYDLTKRSTFASAQRWLAELQLYVDPKCVIMLVGNKIDLVEKNAKKREVTFEEGKKFAEENNLFFVEASALSSFKLNEAFEDLLQEIYNVSRQVVNLAKKTSQMIKLDSSKGVKVHNDKCC